MSEMKSVATRHAPQASGRTARPWWRAASCSRQGRFRSTRSPCRWSRGHPGADRAGAAEPRGGAGGGRHRLRHVVKTTVFLASMDDFAGMNETYAAAFGDHRPARSTVAVKTLPKNVLVEIDVIAQI